MNRDHVDWGLILRTFSTLLGQCSSSEENLQQLESLQFKKSGILFHKFVTPFS